MLTLWNALLMSSATVIVFVLVQACCGGVVYVFSSVWDDVVI